MGFLGEGLGIVAKVLVSLSASKSPRVGSIRI